MKRKALAFTLLEVTLACAIFATAVVVLTSAFANALTAMRRMRDDSNYQPVIQFVRSKIITVKNLYGFENGEELDLPEGGTVKWTAVVEQMPVADLFKVDLTMEFSRTGSEEDAVPLTDTLYLLRPTWSDSDDRDTIISDAETELETARRTVQ